MAGINYRGNQKSAPVWLQDFGGREHIIAFPAKLLVNEFDDEGGTRVTLTTAITSAGANEVQTITINATGGTMTSATILGHAFLGWAWNITAAAVQALMDAQFGTNQVLVSGGPGGTSPLTFTFVNRYGFQDIAAITTVATGLTGGAGTAAVATVTAGAAGASSITVSAISGMIRKGQVLRFDNGVTAIVTDVAQNRATSISVSQITGTAPIGSYAQAGRGNGQKTILGGQLVSRTYTERDANTGFGRYTLGDDEVYLLLFTLDDANNYDDCELVRHGSLIAENYLPNWSSWTTDQKAALRSLYTTEVAFGG